MSAVARAVLPAPFAPRLSGHMYAYTIRGALPNAPSYRGKQRAHMYPGQTKPVLGNATRATPSTNPPQFVERNRGNPTWVFPATSRTGYFVRRMCMKNTNASSSSSTMHALTQKLKIGVIPSSPPNTPSISCWVYPKAARRANHNSNQSTASERGSSLCTYKQASARGKRGGLSSLIVWDKRS